MKRATTRSWEFNLIKIVNDSRNHIISSPSAVVIQDKYPKAKQHYLVLAKENISSIFDLNKSHLTLLEEMYVLGLNVVEVNRGCLEHFKFGFHAKPSMQRLHMHVISQDFVSDCLKTKKHFLSFTTKFFLTYQDAYTMLATHGSIEPLSMVKVQRLLCSALQCNQCSFVAKNIPDLKEHLLHH